METGTSTGRNLIAPGRASGSIGEQSRVWRGMKRGDGPRQSGTDMTGSLGFVFAWIGAVGCKLGLLVSLGNGPWRALKELMNPDIRNEQSNLGARVVGAADPTHDVFFFLAGRFAKHTRGCGDGWKKEKG